MDWDAAQAMTERVCADIFDRTPLRLRPMKRGITGNHKPTIDNDREIFDFMGTIDLEPPSDRIPRHMSSDTGVRNGTVSYDAVLTAHVGAWPYKPAADDHVVELDNGKTWKIVAKEQDGSVRPAWYLSRV